MRTYINHTLKLVMGLGLIAGLSGCDKDLRSKIIS